MIHFNARTVTVPLFRVGVPTPDLARILRALEAAPAFVPAVYRANRAA